jgi:hypothetical protein
MLAYMPDLPMGAFMMKTRFGFLAFICFVSAGTPALAAEATAEEAQRLTGVFQTYLGKESGVVTVTPSGESYDVKLDFVALMAKVTAPGFSIEGSPMEMKLTQKGSGKWLLSQNSPLSYYATMPGGVKIVVKIGNLKSDSIFDQNLAALVSSTSDISDFSIDQTIVMPDGRSAHVAYVIKSARYETVLKPAGLGKFDGTTRSELIGLVEKITMPPSPGASAPVDIVVTAGRFEQEGLLKGLRVQSAAQLFAWFVAQPSLDAIKAEQAELKNLVRNSLPLFDDASSTTAFQTLSVETPFGLVSIANLGLNLSMSGIVADGKLNERLYIVGLRIPDQLVPSWAAQLVPETLVLDFTVADFNLGDPLQILLDSVDLSAIQPNPELETKLLAALLPKGAVTVSMGPSKIVGEIYDFGFEGSMLAGPMATPLGQATIKAKGFDRVIEALKAAPPDVAGKAMPSIIAAKGMAKTEADGSLSWKIENTISGTVLVNGIDVSKIGGGGG